MAADDTGPGGEQDRSEPGGLSGESRLGESAGQGESGATAIFPGVWASQESGPGAVVPAGRRGRRWMVILGAVAALIAAGGIAAAMTVGRGPARAVGTASSRSARPVAATARPTPTPSPLPSHLAKGCQRVLLTQNSGTGPVDHLVICYGMKKLHDAHWRCVVDGGPFTDNSVILCYPVKER